jgi:hypothetical protein
MADIIPVDRKVYWEPREEGLRPVTYNRKSGEYEDVVWTPLGGSQDAFLRCGLLEVLFEGTRGPGKTDALLMDFGQFVGKGHGPDWRGILFRRTYPELGDVIAKSRKWFPQIFPGAKYNAGEHYWTFPEGETLLFRHFKQPDDYWNYHGHAYPWIGWEELTTWPTPECYTSMFSCARSANPQIPIRVRSTTNPYGCVPYGDVLTVGRGWVRIEDVEEGERVWSVGRDGGLVSAEVGAVIRKRWSGRMVSRKGKGLEMVFTEDHRFPVMYESRERGHRLERFDEMAGSVSVRRTCRPAVGGRSDGPQYFYPTDPSLSEGQRQPVFRLTALQYARLMGWAISEGYATRRKTFRICQEKEENRPQIEALLDDCGFLWNYNGREYDISEAAWAAEVERLGYSHQKRIPRELLECGTDVLRELLDALFFGDGSRNVYYTSSEGLANDVAEVGIRLGYSVYMTERHSGWEVMLSHRDVVQLRTGNRIRAGENRDKSVNCTFEEFEGQVYCLSVPETETFFIRQGGCVWLSGNSGHSWVKHRWRLPVGQDRMFGEVITDSLDKNGDVEPPRVAVHGHIQENHVLLYADPGYIARIRSAARNHAELEAWLNGSWDIVAGGMFDDVWDRNVHVLPDIPLGMIPEGWRIDRSYDHGQSRPFSVGWWAESNGEPIKVNNRLYGAVRGDLFRIAEWYGWTGEPNTGARLLSSEIAKGILEREEQWGIRGRVKIGVADGSIFDHYEPGLSVVGEMRKQGLDWYAADKSSGSRKQGWQQIRERMKASFPGEEGVREEAGLFILESCDQFLRTVPVLPRSDRDLDDVDTDAEDHIADEVRYRVRFKTRRIRRGSWK